MRLKKIAVTTILSLFTVLIFAQTGTIRGFVYEKKTGEPVLFTNVYLDGTDYGASTDVSGYFSISKVKPGTYTLTISFVGYEKYEESVTVKAGGILTLKLFLEEASEVLEDFVVDGEKSERQTQIQMSMVKATKKDIIRVPTTGGEADIATYFQTVPGVVTTGDQGGQLYVRGGSPIQNMVLLDGMVIYNPFHSIGFFSVFDTDIISNADIYTGGFNAEYGGRISSVMDITTRDGNKRRTGGKISASPFGAKALVEGPIKKIREDGKGGSISYIFSGKTSYLEQTSKLLYSYIDSAGLPFNYTDLYGKLSFNGSNGSKFNVFGFNYLDSVNWQGISDLQWRARGIGSNFVLIPDGSPVLIKGSVSYSNYGIQLLENNLPPRSSDVNGFNISFDFKYFLGDNEIKYGIDVNGFATKFETFNALNRKISQNESTTEIAGYIVYKIVKGVWLFEPSFRAHNYSSLKTFSPEPRLGVKYNLNEDFRFKLAAGMYSQNLISATSDRDVVNLFYGFLSGPDNLPEQILMPDGSTVDRTHSLQKANHAIFGFEYDWNKRITFNVEGYYKQFKQLTNINRNKIYDESDPGAADKPDVFKKDFIIEVGSAYGVDFVMKYNTKKTYLWAVYSLGKVIRWDGVNKNSAGELDYYAPVFDRRHNINLVGTQVFGKNESWEIDVRWNFGSGLPFTPTAGYTQLLTFSDGISTDYTTSNTNDVSVLYGGLNTKRLPAYHRLDISVKKKIEIKENSVVEMILGVTNVYSRKNIFYVNRVTNQKIYQLPILPSVGVSWTF